MPDYLSCVDTAAKWGISKRRVAILCSEGRIPGSFRIGGNWVIPADAEKPADARIKSGKYIKKTSDKSKSKKAADKDGERE